MRSVSETYSRWMKYGCDEFAKKIRTKYWNFDEKPKIREMGKQSLSDGRIASGECNTCAGLLRKRDRWKNGVKRG